MIRHAIALCLLGALTLGASPAVVDAQPGRRDSAGRGRGPQAGERSPAERAQMERRFEAQITEILRTKVRLSDDQVKQLRAVSVRVEREKRELWRREQDVRGELRRQLLAVEPGSEARIAELLDSLPRLERRRIASMEDEQRELSKFMQPSQRARYFALQDELRRNMQEMQRGRLGTPGDRGGNRGGKTDGRSDGKSDGKPDGKPDGGARPSRSAPPRTPPPPAR